MAILQLKVSGVAMVDPSFEGFPFVIYLHFMPRPGDVWSGGAHRVDVRIRPRGFRINVYRLTLNAWIIDRCAP